AVRAYHAVLQRLKIPPRRSLEEDLTFQSNVSSYAGGSRTFSFGSPSSVRPEEKSPPPDFGKMTSEQRLEYHRKRLDRLLGE
ncbi:MAG: hypothetical protein KDA84_20525, partial [Planctomycetaceae bacterium]|nr:hypothetical protein [Planctomycetaceae bacterium]